MVLIINLVAASFLAGLTLYSQLVHYPLFLHIDKKSFMEYHIHHLKKNTVTILIPMLIEGAFSIMFAFDYSFNIPSIIPIVCLILSTAIWIFTFAKIAPLQDRLTEDGFNKETIEMLIKINWLRLAGWGLKVVLLLYCLSLVVFLM